MTKEFCLGQAVYQTTARADVARRICINNHTNASSLNFYTPVALPDANQQRQSTEDTTTTIQ